MLDRIKRLVNGRDEARPRRYSATWGKYQIPDKLWPYHFAAMGATGSGKTSLLSMLLKDALPHVKEPGSDHRAILFDPKTEFFTELADMGLSPLTHIMNPFDRRCSAWDMARDIRGEPEAKALAELLVSNPGGQNKFFYDAAQVLVKTAIMALIELKPRTWTFRDLLLACDNTSDLKQLLQATGYGESLVNEYLAKTKEAGAIRTTMNTENDNFKVIAAAWHRSKKQMSIDEWTKGQGVMLLGASKRYRSPLAAINRLLLQRVQATVLDDFERDGDDGRRTWVVVDEFASLGTIPHFEELLTEGRSRGVSVYLGFQHINQVWQAYKDTTAVILGNCYHQAYFRTGDVSMADWCAKRFGIIESPYPSNPNFAQYTTTAATVNHFLELPFASKEKGFECIIQSVKDIIDGPKHIRVPPFSKDKNWKKPKFDDEARGRFCPWAEGTLAKLEPWNEEERALLKLTVTAAPGDKVAMKPTDVGATYSEESLTW